MAQQPSEGFAAESGRVMIAKMGMLQKRWLDEPC